MRNVPQHNPLVILDLQKQIQYNVYQIDISGSFEPLSVMTHDRRMIGVVVANVRYDPAEDVIVLEAAHQDSGCHELTDEIILAASQVRLDGELHQVRSGNPYRLDRYGQA